MGVPSAARVLTGWTGSITWDGGEVAPFTRESAASLIARLVREVRVSGYGGVSVSVSAAGVITLSGLLAGVAFSGNTATRTGFTDPYVSGDYTAAGAFSGAWVPAGGLRVADPVFAMSSGTVSGDGSGASAPTRTSRATTIVAYPSTLALPSDVLVYEHDYWFDGRLLGRFVTTDFKFAPRSRYLRTVDSIRFELAVQEVA